MEVLQVLKMRRTMDSLLLLAGGRIECENYLHTSVLTQEVSDELPEEQQSQITSSIASWDLSRIYCEVHLQALSTFSPSILCTGRSLHLYHPPPDPSLEAEDQLWRESGLSVSGER